MQQFNPHARVGHNEEWKWTIQGNRKLQKVTSERNDIVNRNDYFYINK